MSQTCFKAQAMARRLKQQLGISLAGVSVAEAYDADGYPILTVSKGAESLYVFIMNRGNAGRVDALGLPQRAYSPHKVVILREDYTDATTLPTEIAMREKVTAESVKLGAKVEIWEREDVTTAGAVLTGATMVAEIDADPIHKLTNSQ